MSRSNTNTESETINKLKSSGRTSSNTSSNIANSPLFSTTSSLNSSSSSYHDNMSNSSSHEVNNIPKSPPMKGTNGSSIGFDFVGQRRKCKGVGSYKESEFDSIQYKKKIIMEGILERSHSRASLLTSAGSTPMTKS
ncbi:hypothetical protein TSUD_100930 [Trifolium subterraneum]|uniref:Uncharacterized protein n=1 Tax=Trifolium subterraneum TaxID=3900 RepID=A0A2Z6NFF4_TRISU|nr:hypothetical protein TSUD_100930 [Trifolium subterraneum]